MNEDKLDLILTVVSELKGSVDNLGGKVDNLETKVNNLEVKVDNLDSRMSKLETKVDKLEVKVDKLQKDFTDFKRQVTQAFKSLNNRIDVLEKQMFAIGVELKQEIQREINNVRDEINRLENTIMLEQAEKLQDRVRVRELEARVAKLEEKFRLAA